MTKTRKIIRGGKVLASGGFGCVFKPAIKCKGEERDENKITKLMKKKYAKKEYDEIMNFKLKLENVPNYSNYFLIEGFSTCEPDLLTTEDIDNFDKKCSALKKLNITSKNVNDRLNELTALNMPYGGIDVGSYIEKTNFNFEKMRDLNISLIDLLTNGIIPMNNLGVYHCDVKESNILVDESNNEKLSTRLIDWGLSTSINKDAKLKKIPDVLKSRPFQYNVPFSNILFSDLFSEKYSKFLLAYKNPSYFEIKIFVINYVIEWTKERGIGHLKTINQMFKDFFEKEIDSLDGELLEKLLKYSITYSSIFDYIAKILFKYTKNGKIKLKSYLSDVFLKNIDVWGLIITYLPMYEVLNKSYKTLSDDEIDLLHHLKNIILIALDGSDKPINVDHLVKMMRELNSHYEKLINKGANISSNKVSQKLTSNLKTKTKTSKRSGKVSSRSSQKTKKNTQNV
jgi:serine/threonine protein kinase